LMSSAKRAEHLRVDSKLGDWGERQHFTNGRTCLVWSTVKVPRRMKPRGTPWRTASERSFVPANVPVRIGRSG